MMISKTLLQSLRCPETQAPVSPAGERLLQALNEKIRQGMVVNRSGEKVIKALEGALVSANGQLFYPMRDGIPLMLKDESITLKH